MRLCVCVCAYVCVCVPRLVEALDAAVGPSASDDTHTDDNTHVTVHLSGPSRAMGQMIRSVSK